MLLSQSILVELLLFSGISGYFVRKLNTLQTDSADCRCVLRHVESLFCDQ